MRASTSWQELVAIHQRTSAPGRAPGTPRRDAIVLAGGSGRRLAGYARTVAEAGLSKQFCAFESGRSLLVRTLERIGALVAPSRTWVSVRREHAAVARAQLGASAARLVIQPSDCGTAPGLLLPLIEALVDAPEAAVLVTPADHGVAREPLLREAVEHAFAVVETDPDRIVLIGSEPEGAATDYGWIVPALGAAARRRRGRAAHGSRRPCGASPVAGAATRARAVASFVEKPSLAAARRLERAGGLWSTMILVGGGRALFSLFEQATRPLVRLFVHAAALGARERSAYLANAYASIPSLDFSAQILARAEALSVVALPREAGWTDLGTPERLRAWLGERESDADAPSAA
jgi:mannose-1-phosphate guanylyltransferase